MIVPEAVLFCYPEWTVAGKDLTVALKSCRLRLYDWMKYIYLI